MVDVDISIFLVILLMPVNYIINACLTIRRIKPVLTGNKMEKK